MSTFLDYIDWRGDLPFSRDPFNEVDNLIFSQIVYADFKDNVPAPGEEGTVLSHLRPVGRVRFGDRAFEAISEADFVDPGRRVRVVSVSENKIIVVPVEEEQ